MTRSLGFFVLVLTLAWAIKSLGATQKSSLQTSVYENSDHSQFSLKHHLIADVGPALGGSGYGLSYQYRFDQVMVGAFYSTRTSREDYIFFTDLQFTQNRIGVEGRYLFREIERSGPYVGLSAYKFDLQGKGTVSLFGYKLAESETEKKEGFGWGTKFGWLWSTFDRPFGRLTLDLALSYETANRYKYSYSGNTTSSKSEIKDIEMGLGAVFAAGLLF